MKNWYEQPASKLGMTAAELVHNRVAKVAELQMNGARIQDTAMLHAFAKAITA